MSEMTPREIVSELDQHIIGQKEAKRAVAIALRNRWRRMQLQEPLRHEVTPKNILMIGPTGVGKTEIARRLAKLANAPFIKVEATKFTEVGYVGKEVDSIIRDLTDSAMKLFIFLPVILDWHFVRAFLPYPFHLLQSLTHIVLFLPRIHEQEVNLHHQWQSLSLNLD